MLLSFELSVEVESLVGRIEFYFQEVDSKINRCIYLDDDLPWELGRWPIEEQVGRE